MDNIGQAGGDAYPELTDQEITQLPVLAFTAERFAEALADFILLYAIEVPRSRHNGARRDGTTLDIDDPRLAWLQEHWECYGWGPQGQQNLLCPFKAGHSVDSGESECSYFPAGTRGYHNGHWHCLHASCEGRSDEEYDAEVGYEPPALVFPDLTEVEQAPVPAIDEVRPRFIGVNLKTGEIPANAHNVMLALQTPSWFGMDMAIDTFKDEVMFKAIGSTTWRPLVDEDYMAIRRTLDLRGFVKPSAEIVRSAVRAVARTYQYDSAQDWLKSKVWDGVERVNAYLETYFGSTSGPVATAISRYWWTAMAARIMYPGCRCDMVPILVSEEGRWKSSALQAMVPFKDWFIEIDLSHKDDNTSRNMRGAVLGELAELRGLAGRTAEANKAWVTRRFEKWTPKFIEFAHRMERRITFVGTTNEEEMLDETTGERRWLPIKVAEGDRARIIADRDQLWAEAREIVAERMRQPGRLEEDAPAWEDAHELGVQARQEFIREDSWVPAVGSFIDSRMREAVANGKHEIFCTIGEALRHAAELPPGKYEKRHEMRMGKILRDHGLVKCRTVLGGRRVSAYTITVPYLA